MHPAARIVDDVRGGRRTAVEVVSERLAVIEARNPGTNALVLLDAEGALRRAAQLDRRLRSGRRLGALAGVPVVVKDNIDVGGQPTTGGSAALAARPAVRDAAVVTRLRAADAVVLGRANMDELAMGASTQTSAYGPTRNPLDERRSPGGSSGGSAAAVAAGMAPLSVGTDTGGSIREPASQCGIVGMAPTPGVVPLRGVLPFDPDLDRVGPMAASVADTRLLLSVLAGRQLRPRRERLTRTRVGVPVELVGARNRKGVLACFERAVGLLEDRGVEVVPVALPEAPGALAVYMRLTSYAVLPVLDSLVTSGRAGAEVIRRHEFATALSDRQLSAARAERQALRHRCARLLDRVDALLSPTMPTTAPLLFGDIPAEDLTDPLSAPYTDCWTVVASLAGLPSVSVPAGVSPDDGMPVGVMFAGRPGSDGPLLDLAELLAP